MAKSILQSPDISINYHKVTETGPLYDVTYHSEPPQKCSACGKQGCVKRKDVAVRTLKDYCYASPITVKVHFDRYYCKNCGAIYYETDLPGVGKNKTLTDCFLEEIEKLCLSEPADKLAEAFAISASEIRKITNEYIARRAANWVPYTPEELGLKAVLIAGGKALLCADLRRSGIVDVLPYHTLKDLKLQLSERFDFDTVRYITMDFDIRLCKNLRELSPNQSIIFDKEGVLEKVDAAFDESLNEAPIAGTSKINLKNSNEYLQNAMFIFNLCHEMYEPDSHGSDTFFMEIANNRKKSYKPMNMFVRRCNDHQYEIDSFFDHDYPWDTRQYAMQLFWKIRASGSHYSFERLKARLMYFDTPETISVAKPILSPEDGTNEALNSYAKAVMSIIAPKHPECTEADLKLVEKRIEDAIREVIGQEATNICKNSVRGNFMPFKRIFEFWKSK